MKYEVTFGQHRYYKTTVVVEADHEDHANDLATDLLDNEELPWVEDSREEEEIWDIRPLKPTG